MRKKDKNTTHYIPIRDQLVCVPPNQKIDTSQNVSSPKKIKYYVCTHVIITYVE